MYVCAWIEHVGGFAENVCWTPQIDTATIDFRDPQLASLVTLTAADRKWMDDVSADSSSSEANCTEQGYPTDCKNDRLVLECHRPRTTLWHGLQSIR